MKPPVPVFTQFIRRRRILTEKNIKNLWGVLFTNSTRGDDHVVPVKVIAQVTGLLRMRDGLLFFFFFSEIWPIFLLLLGSLECMTSSPTNALSDKKKFLALALLRKPQGLEPLSVSDFIFAVFAKTSSRPSLEGPSGPKYSCKTLVT